MPRYFYYSDIKSFLGESLEQIFGKLSRNDEYDTAATQKYAWEQEIVHATGTVPCHPLSSLQYIFKVVLRCFPRKNLQKSLKSAIFAKHY
jgi:hypothetical protein